MKKLSLLLLLLFGIQQSYAQCTQDEKSYEKYSLIINYKDNVKLPQFECIDLLYSKNWDAIKWKESPLMMSQSFDQFRYLVRNINDWDLNTKIAQKDLGENILVVRMLMPYVNAQKRKELKNDAEQVKQNYPDISGKFNEFNDEDNKKIIKFLAEKYNKGHNDFVDKFDHTPLSYAVLTNNVDIINKLTPVRSLSSIVFEKDIYGLTVLHLLFSSELKGKDTRLLNDYILNNIETRKIIHVQWNGIDYFQFAEVMKDNNPDLYKKLNKLFSFSIKVNKDVEKIIKNAPLNYISELTKLL